MAVTLIVTVLVYTQWLVNELKDSTRQMLQQRIRTYSALVSSDNPDLIALALEQIQEVDFPIVVTDAAGTPKHWKNVPVPAGDTGREGRERLRALVKTMDQEGNQPLPIYVSAGQVDWFHYGDSIVIQQLRWLPWVEIVAATLFIIVGYTGFSNIRRSEERMVWVGLAKETAHQLGTPLTSLMGWTELLKSGGDVAKAVPEMERDIERLERVTARFSQIGSEPALRPMHVKPLIYETVDYFRSRLPRTGAPIDIACEINFDPVVAVNPELFTWVMENLVKNSIDALRSTGGWIRIVCDEKADWVNIDVADNGPGISTKHKRVVFRPGFSTKTRGWGLGLSLSRRIVEEYHSGRIQIKETSPGRGTVMRVSLRKDTHAV